MDKASLGREGVLLTHTTQPQPFMQVNMNVRECVCNIIKTAIRRWHHQLTQIVTAMEHNAIIQDTNAFHLHLLDAVAKIEHAGRDTWEETLTCDNTTVEELR